MIHWLACLLICCWPVTSPVRSAAILPRQLGADAAPNYVIDDVSGDENAWDKLESEEAVQSELRRLGLNLGKDVPESSLTADEAIAAEEGQAIDGDKRSFSPWAGKRAFSPWAGKRAFSPWAGKRAFSPWAGKRAFSPWAGKRGADGAEQADGGVKRAFSPWAGKRAFSPWAGKRAFSPWAGKRSAASNLDEKRESTRWYGNRGSFNPWAGKRDSEVEDKRAFHPWGGKRSTE